MARCVLKACMAVFDKELSELLFAIGSRSASPAITRYLVLYISLSKLPALEGAGKRQKCWGCAVDCHP